MNRGSNGAAWRRIGLGVLVSGLLAPCGTVPYTQRNQLMTISNAEEAELGEAAFQDAKDGASLIADSRLDLIRWVGERIAAAAKRDDFRWEFILIESDEANAFALPGGKVAFYSGILPYCVDEDGIAAVMAHEVAHVLSRHGAERLSQARLLEYGGTAISVVFSGGAPAVRKGVLGAYGMGGKLGVLLPFSRKHEAEADEIGLVLMAKAGYDPRTAIDFWRRLLSGGKGGKTSEILSSHPSGEERIRRLEEMMPIAVEYYRKAGPAPRRLEEEREKPPDITPEEILKSLQEPAPLD